MSVADACLVRMSELADPSLRDLPVGAEPVERRDGDELGLAVISASAAPSAR